MKKKEGISQQKNSKMAERQISIVLPINAKNYYDLCLCFYLLESIRQFFNLFDISNFYIICKENKIRKLSRLYKKYTKPLKIKFIAEESLLPEIQISKYRGWLVQQLLKIAISNIVETDFYLVLDSDVICCKPSGYDKLIKNDKIINGKQLLEFDKLEHFSRHRDNMKWLEASANVIGLKQINGIMYGITPIVVSKQIMIDLQKEIGDNHLKNWIEFLLEISNNTQWTEYGLYFSFVKKGGIQTKYYNIDDTAILIDYDKCFIADEISKNIRIAEKMVDFAFSNFYKGQFFVVQSYTAPPLRKRSALLKRIGRHFRFREHLIYFSFACLADIKNFFSHIFRETKFLLKD